MKDLSCLHFDRLVAVYPTDARSITGAVIWFCQCICGKTKLVASNELSSGLVRSCGCLHIESARRQGLASRTHGDRTNRRRTPEYRAWDSMKQRCLNPNTDNYADYGGRGITICPSWLNFSAFLADMGRKPSPSHSLDRIDVDGNYQPTNCRWATPKEQANNTRRNKHYAKRI